MSEVWPITGASRGLGRAYGALSLSWGEVLGVEGKRTRVAIGMTRPNRPSVELPVKTSVAVPRRKSICKKGATK